MPTVDMIATGRNIKDIMKGKGMTAKDIQAVFGFNTPQAIFKWFRGDTIPTVDNLVILANIFEMKMDDIVVVNK